MLRTVSVILEEGGNRRCTEQSWAYEGLRVHVFEKVSLTAASMFDGGLCSVDCAVPAKPAEDS